MRKSAKNQRTDQWKAAPYGAGRDEAVPAGSGVYVLAEVTRLEGLVLEITPLYVGKSKSLRRRWREHVGNDESNPGLLGLHRRTALEFWWRRTPEHEITKLERQLIAELQPPLNRQGIRRRDDGPAGTGALAS